MARCGFEEGGGHRTLPLGELGVASIVSWSCVAIQSTTTSPRTGSTFHLLDPPIVQQPIFSSSWIWEVASAQDPRLKLSLVRSTLQHWVSRPSCHLAQFPSQPTMMVEHLQPAVKKYQHCPTCTMVAPELESAPITTVAALVQIGGGGNNRSFRD